MDKIRWDALYECREANGNRRSYPKFCDTYRGLADRWTLLDGSASPPIEVARGQGEGSREVIDAERWAMVASSASTSGEGLGEAGERYAAIEEGYTSGLREVLEAVGDFWRKSESANQAGSSFSLCGLFAQRWS